jgi:hypothetical protein
MCFKLAYPKGDASEDVMAINSKGNKICLDGKMGGILRAPVRESRGADAIRYTRPVIAANADCTVFRKIE